MSNIIVTGGSGFIGSHIVNFLEKENHKVFNIDTKKISNKENIEIDINNFKEISEFIKKNNVDYIFHIAAIANARKSIEDTIQTVDVNIKGTSTILEAASNFNVKKVILASTVWVFNACKDQGSKQSNEKKILDENSKINPQGGGHFYTTSKIASELLCHDYKALKNLNFTILRYGIPYGEGMWPGLVLRSFVENALNKKPLIINGDGSAKRRFIHVHDLARAHVLSLNEKSDNKIISLEGNIDTTIKELANLVSHFIPGTQVEFKIDNTRKGELDVENYEISNDFALKCINWKPEVQIKEGVKNYIEWFKKSN